MRPLLPLPPRLRRAALRVVAAASLVVTPGALVAQGATAPVPGPVITVVRAMALEGAPDTVTIAGRATVPSNTLHGRALDIAIDDGTAGMRVFSRALKVEVAAGDSVVARGVVRRYRGGLELDATSLQVVPGPRRLVEPQELPAPRVGSADEGRLVRVHGVASAMGSSEGGQWVLLRGLAPESRDSVTLWVSAAHQPPKPLADVREGDELVVTGIVNAFQDNPSDPRVWQVLPRTPDDVAHVGVPARWKENARLALVGIALAFVLVLVVARWSARRHGRALAEAEARYAQLLSLSPDGVLVYADDRILFANQATARLLGVEDAKELVGQPVARFWPQAATATAQSLTTTGGAATPLPAVGRTSGPTARDAAQSRVRTRLVTAQGEGVDVEVSASPCRYHDRDATVVLARDVRAQLRHERELRALAQLDDLTGLFNRRGFQLHAETMRREHALAGRAVVLVVADLDALKAINDTYGHATGDAAIRAVAAALRGALGEDALVARWGGDEFVALATPPQNVTDPVQALDERLQDLLDAVHVDAAGRLVTAASSVGVAPLPPGGASTTAEALAAADARLYERKRARRSVLNG